MSSKYRRALNMQAEARTPKRSWIVRASPLLMLQLSQINLRVMLPSANQSAAHRVDPFPDQVDDFLNARKNFDCSIVVPLIRDITRFCSIIWAELARFDPLKNRVQTVSFLCPF